MPKACICFIVLYYKKYIIIDRRQRTLKPRGGCEVVCSSLIKMAETDVEIMNFHEQK